MSPTTHAHYILYIDAFVALNCFIVIVHVTTNGKHNKDARIKILLFSTAINCTFLLTYSLNIRALLVTRKWFNQLCCYVLCSCFPLENTRPTIPIICFIIQCYYFLQTSTPLENRQNDHIYHELRLLCTATPTTLTLTT